MYRPSKKILIVAAAALITGGVGFFFYQKSQPAKGWIRYRTDSFQIDYPNKQGAEFPNTGNLTGTDAIDTGSPDPHSDFNIFDGTHNMSVRPYALLITSEQAQDEITYNEPRMKKINLHGYTAFQDDHAILGAAEEYFRTTFIHGPRHLYIIEMDEDASGSYDALYESIVKTFRIR